MSKTNRIAYKLQFLMLQHGISATDLSIHTQIERSTLTKILNGSTINPRIDTINSLAKYFNVNISELINEDNYLDELKLSSHHLGLENIILHLMTINGITTISLLSKYTGVSMSILSDILNKKTLNPHISTLQQIASFFNISVPELIGIERIPEYKTTAIIPSTQVLPVILLEQVNSWFQGEVKQVFEYATAFRKISGKKSFAINISNDQFAPDFFNNYTLIVDNEETPADTDFFIGKIQDKISLFECISIEGSILEIREAGSNDIFSIDTSEITLLGVIVQHVINSKRSRS